MEAVRRGPYGDVYEPDEITEDMLPQVDEVWWDTYAADFRGTMRSITVEAVKERHGSMRGGLQVWEVRCRENSGSGRMFTMHAEGFLSRYKRTLSSD